MAIISITIYLGERPCRSKRRSKPPVDPVCGFKLASDCQLDQKDGVRPVMSGTCACGMACWGSPACHALVGGPREMIFSGLSRSGHAESEQFLKSPNSGGFSVDRVVPLRIFQTFHTFKISSALCAPETSAQCRFGSSRGSVAIGVCCRCRRKRRCSWGGENLVRLPRDVGCHEVEGSLCLI